MRHTRVLGRALAGAVLGLGLSVGLAAPAQAAIVDGGTLTRGVPVTGIVATPGQDIEYHFAGAAGQHVTFDVSASSWTNGGGAGYAFLYVYDPSNRYRGYVYLRGGATYGDFDLTVTGTWRALLDPGGASVGRATFTLFGDLPDQTIVAGTPVNAVIAHRGQNALYHFAGFAGQHVTFDVSASTWTNGGTAGYAYLYLYDPSNRYRGYVYLRGGATFADFDLTVTGTWRAVLNPGAGSIGAATFTLVGDLPDRAVAPNTPVTTVIAHRGQNALYHFAAVLGQHVTVNVTASSWSNAGASGYAYLYLYDPAGNYRGAVYVPGGATHRDFAITKTGTWRAVLDPGAASVGFIVFTLNYH